jgi:small conductance mechanosensitive channel
MLWQQDPAAADATAQAETASAETIPAEALPQDPAEAVEQAAGTLQRLILDFYALLPKLVIALILIALAIVIARFIRAILKRALRNWRRAEAASALVGIGIVLLAIGAAMSVIAGDATALVGSVGLVGLALSWALQAPIESFTGWLLNSFRVYYRVGDRIAVGDVFGDVYRIDILSTTVWEAGGPDKPVQGAQPTGALATFPNSEILRATIVNYTRHFPYVWDEVTFSLANESDLGYSKQVLEAVAAATLAPAKPDPSKDFQRLLRRRHLNYEIDADPQVFFSNAESWTNATIRYLVPARERRKWASDLIIAISAELAHPQHTGRMIDGYPRTRIDLQRRPES